VAARREPTCIFCKVVSGEIPAREVFRDEELLVVEDVNPQAPVHLLVMPTNHVRNASGFIESAEPQVVARLFAKATQIGRERGPDGYRLVVNEGSQGGQTVDHLHVHVLAGRHMRWPPGIESSRV